MDGAQPPPPLPTLEDWRSRVTPEVRRNVIEKLTKIMPEGPMRKQWEAQIQKHETQMFITAKSLEDYNANIKKAFEIGKNRVAKQPMPPQTAYVPPAQSIAQPPAMLHVDASSSQQTITALPDAIPMAFPTSAGSTPATAIVIPAAPTSIAPSSMPSVYSSATFTGNSIAKPPAPAPNVVAVSATSGTPFNKLPPKPAAHVAPVAKPSYAAPPPLAGGVVVGGGGGAPIAPPSAVGLSTNGVAVAAASLAAPQHPSTAAQLAEDEKYWSKLEMMRAKFEAPLKSILESLLKSGKDDGNIAPVQKMIEFLNSPRDGRPKRSYEDLEKTETKMRLYFERMFQKKATAASTSAHVSAAPTTAPAIAPSAAAPKAIRPPTIAPPPSAAVAAATADSSGLNDIDFLLDAGKRTDSLMADDNIRGLFCRALASSFDKSERRVSTLSVSPMLIDSALTPATPIVDPLRASRSEMGGNIIAKEIVRVPFVAPAKRARISPNV